MTDEEIIKAYAGGLTCYKQYSMLFRGEVFSILRHRSHSEYIDRSVGSETCEACVVIVKNGAGFSGKYGAREILTGRLNKAKKAVLQKLLVEIHDMGYIHVPEGVDNINQLMGA